MELISAHAVIIEVPGSLVKCERVFFVLSASTLDLTWVVGLTWSVGSGSGRGRDFWRGRSRFFKIFGVGVDWGLPRLITAWNQENSVPDRREHREGMPQIFKSRARSTSGDLRRFVAQVRSALRSATKSDDDFDTVINEAVYGHVALAVEVDEVTVVQLHLSEQVLRPGPAYRWTFWT